MHVEEHSSPDLSHAADRTNLRTDRFAGIDPAFIVDFVPYDDGIDAEDPDSADALGPGRRWSTWLDVEPLCRGPQPRPDWVVTSQGAIDTELGILKSGKEADAFLLERADPHHPDSAVIMVAKRYRTSEHRSFQRSAAYTEGRSTRRSRDERALKRKSTWGRTVAQSAWANAEWAALVRCHELGLPVPYPVQIDGTELLMEWICIEGEEGYETAPRLAQTRPDRILLAGLFDQLREAMHTLAQAGFVHGDLSAYNLLVAGERLVVIDLPQVVDLAGNAAGPDFLLRDCTNVCTWFRSRGLDVDEQALYAELLTHAF